jgi:ribulose-phosphate 3-epimerase
MAIIVPAILPSSKEDLEGKLARLPKTVRDIQIDIVDGQYVAPATWPYDGSLKAFEHGVRESGEALPYVGQFNVEVDLMVRDAEHVVGTWIDAGAKRITLHAESIPQLPKVLGNLQVHYGHDKGFAPDLLSIGLAIQVTTDISLIEPYMNMIDYVQFMGIASIGKQGQPFDTRVLQKIRQFKRLHPDMPVQVDGGVSLTTAPELFELGVNRLVVGSALFKQSDIGAAIEEFKKLAGEYGVDGN